VVDDGSSDSAALATVIANYPKIHLLAHDTNRGMCAGRNTGIAASRGEVVMILDADDALVSDWPSVLAHIMREWPDEINICYAACRNPEGKVTAQEPGYTGLLTLSDILNERHSGEYLPVFRGDYVRGKPYINLGTRKSCGIVSYINFAQDGPFWISNQVIRIYDDARFDSVSFGWTNSNKTAETAKCYLELFQRYGNVYQREAPKIWLTKQLRLAVYLRLAGMPNAWHWWWKGASLACPKESVGALIVLAFGSGVGGWIAQTGKRIGWIRRYG